ncbi:MAG: tRNA (adenosine(37)-N6)-threonylcarbamoyltransferase complex dimerization subunit type 1 TsaB [Eubacterium sp.]|nr:tRNA (adenosine(37)-N6)-threonylcarbamoyltransferase complex dimerization subunit type 1 TsaB [Eubacterium sp.]
MKILALDSSGLVASAAILDEESVIAEYTMNYKKTHSQTLLPMVDEIVRMTQQDLKTLDAIAVAAGPGSFTGLRIGSATAKGLGQALNKPLISVPTLEGLAYNLFGSESIICPMMDARRKQVYTGIYTWSDEVFQVLMDQTACPVEEVLLDCVRYSRKADRPVILLGDGVPVYREMIGEKLAEAGTHYLFAPPHLNRQRAGAVGVRALELAREGKLETAASHVPVYLRKSQAERELERKKAAKAEVSDI